MKPIVVTAGEPAGIGPDLLLDLAQANLAAPIVAITDRQLLLERARLLGKTLALPVYSRQTASPPAFSVLHVPLAATSVPGELNPANAAFVMEVLQQAVSGTLAGEFSALVTGPVNKAVINAAGFNFCGHTEYLAMLTAAPKSVMLFAHDEFRLVLLTTHVPLAEVPSLITEKNIVQTLRITAQALRKYFKIQQPKILVTGLNPHAGEMGYLGKEEITTIIPSLEKLRAEGLHIVGPLAADSAFDFARQNSIDVIVTMYHDQGLPVLKTLGFHQMVNVTLGLPIIRTSVDHGTALALAGTGKADASSLKRAVALAIKMAEQ